MSRHIVRKSDPFKFSDSESEESEENDGVPSDQSNPQIPGFDIPDLDVMDDYIWQTQFNEG